MLSINLSSDQYSHQASLPKNELPTPSSLVRVNIENGKKFLYKAKNTPFIEHKTPNSLYSRVQEEYKTSLSSVSVPSLSNRVRGKFTDLFAQALEGSFHVITFNFNQGDVRIDFEETPKQYRKRFKHKQSTIPSSAQFLKDILKIHNIEVEPNDINHNCYRCTVTLNHSQIKQLYSSLQNPVLLSHLTAFTTKLRAEAQRIKGASWGFMIWKFDMGTTNKANQLEQIAQQIDNKRDLILTVFRAQQPNAVSPSVFINFIRNYRAWAPVSDSKVEITIPSSTTPLLDKPNPISCTSVNDIVDIQRIGCSSTTTAQNLDVFTRGLSK